MRSQLSSRIWGVVGERVRQRFDSSLEGIVGVRRAKDVGQFGRKGILCRGQGGSGEGHRLRHSRQLANAPGGDSCVLCWQIYSNRDMGPREYGRFIRADAINPPTKT